MADRVILLYQNADMNKRNEYNISYIIVLLLELKYQAIL